jgi:hypothetical protein
VGALPCERVLTQIFQPSKGVFNRSAGGGNAERDALFCHAVRLLWILMSLGLAKTVASPRETKQQAASCNAETSQPAKEQRDRGGPGLPRAAETPETPPGARAARAAMHGGWGGGTRKATT